MGLRHGIVLVMRCVVQPVLLVPRVLRVPKAMEGMLQQLLLARLRQEQLGLPLL